MKPLQGKKVALIGSGNMAGAMIGALLRKNEITPDQISASDPSPEAQKIIKDKYGISVTGDNRDAIKSADLVILSVKPQVLPVVMSELKGKIPSGSLVFYHDSKRSFPQSSDSINAQYASPDQCRIDGVDWI